MERGGKGRVRKGRRGRKKGREQRGGSRGINIGVWEDDIIINNNKSDIAAHTFNSNTQEAGGSLSSKSAWST